MTVSRRQVLLGAVGIGGVSAAAGALEMRHRLARIVHPVPEPASTLPATEALIESGSFRSRARGGRAVGWSIAYPATEVRELGVAIVLHGRGDNHATVFGSHAWGRYLIAAVGAGVPPFAVAAADGGDHTYWHRRLNGDDPQLMLLTEFLPLLARKGLRTDRLALAGWSMGGYGALLLAERIGNSHCAAVAVDSPALWRRAADSAPGAFDDAVDFAAHDVFANPSRLTGIPVRIAVGTSDPFVEATRAFASELRPPPAVDFSRGGHDLAFWRHSAPHQIAFLGQHLRA